MTILKEQVAAVLDRRERYEEAEAYYEGDVPETFATASLRRAFRLTGSNSRLNFCRPVVDAVNNRLEISAIVGDSQVAKSKIDAVWQDNELYLEAQEIHRRALALGDCYVAVWPDEDGRLLASYNSPKSMAIVYDVENPRKKAYAVKMWKSGENQTRLNIYTADKIYKYLTNSTEVTEGTNWTPAGSVDNPWNEVPVFHFRTQRPMGRAEHFDGYHAQNHINKLFITSAFTVDYQGAPQRWALSKNSESEMTDFDEAATERETSGLKNGPGEMWLLKNIDAVGEFKPADPDNFWKPIEKTVRSLAALTNTPLHYFDKSGAVLSGNALRTAEAPLLKKVKDRQESFGATWREMFRFILKVEGIKSDVQVIWTPVESLDELERWDVALKKINAGLSHQQALREGGYPEDQILKIMDERRQEAEAGLYYTRAPQVRVNTEADETQSVEADAA